LAILAAGTAVFLALRASWIPSLVLVALAMILGRAGGIAKTQRGFIQAGEVSLEEARSILGVDAAAGRAEVQEAYRRLIRRAHPDLGGSTGLAARVNAARDRLLRDL
jgi:hypothetical protein